FLQKYSYLESKLIISEDRNNYLILLYGKNGDRYFHDFMVHVKLQNGRINLLKDSIYLEYKLFKAGLDQFKYDYYRHPCNTFQCEFAIDLAKVYELHKSCFISDTNPKQPTIKLDATVEELKELSTVESKYTRKAVASHPNISLELLLELLNEFPTEIFNNPSFDIFRKREKDFLRTIFNAFPDSYYSFDQLDFVLPDFFLEWMFEQQEKLFWYFVRCSHKIPPKYLERLMDDDDCTTFAYLICRWNIPFYNNVVGNYHIPNEIIEKIWERHRYFEKVCQKKNKFNHCIGECEGIISSA
ncbi:element excision factor XisI family protein, partial [Hyella patelloides]|uniref:element excision factor XisI family protein n=1 Tax=Hyella patelloides TaxID=1982969 RepID=UPI00119DE9F9